MLFVVESEIVGKNSNVSVRVLQTSNDNFSINVNIPIDKFDSGNSKRDKNVAEILQQEKNPNLIFQSDTMDRDDWQNFWKQEEFPLTGTLRIGDNSYPLTIHINTTMVDTMKVISGIYIGKFTQFGLEVPKVGPMGIIANATDYLELHFHFVVSKIIGINQIF
mgnify:FL=1